MLGGGIWLVNPALSGGVLLTNPMLGGRVWLAIWIRLTNPLLEGGAWTTNNKIKNDIYSNSVYIIMTMYVVCFEIE